MSLLTVWQYIKTLWEGPDGKPSLKRFIAIYLVYDFQDNLSFAVKKWGEGRSMEGLYLSLGLEAALIAALIGVTSFFNWKERQTPSPPSLSDPHDKPNPYQID